MAYQTAPLPLLPQPSGPTGTADGPSVTDVTHGGNYTATSEVDYFVFDYDALQGQIGTTSTGRISGFDPTRDKIVLEHFSMSSAEKYLWGGAVDRGEDAYDIYG